MPLVDDLRAFLLKTDDSPTLSDQLIALCHVLDEALAGKLDKLPARHAEGTEPSITARSKRPARRAE